MNWIGAADTAREYILVSDAMSQRPRACRSERLCGRGQLRWAAVGAFTLSDTRAMRGGNRIHMNRNKIAPTIASSRKANRPKMYTAHPHSQDPQSTQSVPI